MSFKSRGAILPPKNQLTRFRLRRSACWLGGVMFSACLGVSNPVYALATGGDWYESPCEPGTSGQDYVGFCKSEEDFDVDGHSMTLEAETAQMALGVYNDQNANVSNLDLRIIDSEVTGAMIAQVSSLFTGVGHGQVNDNYLLIDNSQVADGGVSSSFLTGYAGEANRNRIEIINGSNVNGEVFGALILDGWAYGMYTVATENQVLLRDSTANNVVGAQIGSDHSRSTANYNSVEIVNSVVDSAAGVDVWGVTLGEVKGNATLIDQGAQVRKAIGANALVYGEFDIVDIESDVTIDGNSLKISGSSQVDEAYGALIEAYHDPSRGKLNPPKIANNALLVEGASEVGLAVGTALAICCDQDSPLSIEKSQVLLTDNSTAQEVYGGMLDTGGGADTGIVTQSSVSVTRGSRVDSSVFGGFVSAGDAEDNVVSIDDSWVGDSVYGGYTERGQASGNKVAISGNSSIANEVIAGMSAEGDAVGNRVTITGSPQLASVMLKGGVATNGQSSGNTLEVRSKDIEARNIEAFQDYEFVLPTGTAAGDTMLRLNDGSGTILGEGTVRVGSQSPNFSLEVGERVALINNAAGLDSEHIDGDLQSIPDGAFLIRDVQLARDAENLFIEVTEKSLSDQSKTPLEGRLGGFALLDQSAVRNGDALSEAVAATKDSENGTGVFAVMTGGGSRYKTGSHIDVKGVGLTFGAVKALETDVGITHIGAFVEGASGHHHSHNRFDDLSVRGHGSTRYLGAGLLAKHDWDTDGQGGPYVEGSIRGGRLSMDWRTSDLSNTAGTVDYDSAAGYVAAHAGVGYTLPLTEKTSLDLSAKYFWTRLGSDDVTIDGDDFHMKAINSSVSQLGATLKHQFDEHTEGYVGIAWEHEFNGKARASVHQMNPTSPSLKGSTGVLDAGLILRPEAEGPLSIQLGVRGYTGTRRGASGLLNVNYAF